MLYYQVYAVGR